MFTERDPEVEVPPTEEPNEPPRLEFCDSCKKFVIDPCVPTGKFQ